MRLVRPLIITVLAVLAGLYALAVVVFAIAMIGGLRDGAMEVKFDRPDPSLVADYNNGLGPAQREGFYHLSQGSEIMPWFWLTAVDAADSAKPFVEDLERYGLLPDPGRDDGLPVGLTVASNPFTFGADFVGVNCAACHVGELHHDGKAVRVDGAPNMFNLQLFYSDAIDAVMAATPSRPDKLWRALKRLGRQDYARYGIAAPFVRPATLLYYGANVLLHRDRFDARYELVQVIDLAKDQRDKAHPTSGFGRLDAFDGTRNFLFTRLRKADESGGFKVNTANMVKLDAPVKFPWLWSLKASPPGPIEAYREKPQDFPRVWGFKDYDWIEWTIDTNTVMERNITETLGAGATVVLDPNSASLFESSIPVRNMHELEWLAYYIDPPKWPAAIFGETKPDLVAAGKNIFDRRCAGCHEYADDQRTETGLIRLRGKSLDIAGTDPTAALKISCPVPEIGGLKVTPSSYTLEDSKLLEGCAGVKAGEPFSGNSFAKTVKVAVDGVKDKAFAAAGIGADEQRTMEDLAQHGDIAWRDTLVDTRPPGGPYAARPLYGIWAAAPYLHNGSVPTLYDLLLPPDQRPKKFALGARDYDPVKLGFVVATDCRPTDCLVDTTLADYGNGNGGHIWGTNLSEADRMALLEYLKTY
jgi:hypothetical protein